MAYPDPNPSGRTRIFELMRQHDAAHEFVSKPEPVEEKRDSAEDLEKLLNMAIQSFEKRN